MENSLCKKAVSLLALYVENKLNDEDNKFVEGHIMRCRSCYRKYIEMKEIINNLHFEYEKLIDEFERAESDRIFNIREYETFYGNISPYIDDELCYDDSVKFRKYLLKSKPARKELACAYGLKNGIKNSVNDFKNKLNVNYSRKIINKLKEEHRESFDYAYVKAAVMLGIMIFSLVLVTCFIVLGYFNKSYAQENSKISAVIKPLEFPKDSELVEFYFDEKGNAILTDK